MNQLTPTPFIHNQFKVKNLCQDQHLLVMKWNLLIEFMMIYHTPTQLSYHIHSIQELESICIDDPNNNYQILFIILKHLT